MPKAPTELAVIVKMYDLLIWSSRHIEKFARSHRFTLGQRLEEQLYRVLEKLLRAKYNRERAGLLREANMELELTRFLFRVAKDLRCLSLDSYGHAARNVNEIGQMVGGWLKSGGGPS